MPIQTTLISMTRNKIDHLVVEGGLLVLILGLELSGNNNKSNNSHCHYNKKGKITVGDEARSRRKMNMKDSTLVTKKTMS
jgi:hypothetical protein